MDQIPTTEARRSAKPFIITGIIVAIIVVIAAVVFVLKGKPSLVSPLPTDEGVRVVFVTPNPSATLEPSAETSPSATSKASVKASPKATPKASAITGASATPKPSASPSTSPAT